MLCIGKINYNIKSLLLEKVLANVIQSWRKVLSISNSTWICWTVSNWQKTQLFVWQMCHLKHDELCQSTTCPLNGYATSNAVFEICEIKYISGHYLEKWQDTKRWKTNRDKQNQDYYSDSTSYNFFRAMWGICNSTQSMKKYQIPLVQFFAHFYSPRSPVLPRLILRPFVELIKSVTY